MTTIREIARLAGVSVTTVSNVLNNKPNVGAETRNRVLRIIEQENYRPNSAARELVTQRSQSLGIVFPYVPSDGNVAERGLNYYVSEVIMGIEKTVQAAGYDLLIAGSSGEAGEDPPPMLKNGRVRGVFLVGGMFDDQYVLQLATQGIPIVMVGTHVDQDHIDCIVADNFRGAYNATKHLISLGHSRIGFVNTPAKAKTSFEKENGYRQALLENDIPFEESLVAQGDFSTASGYRAAQILLRRYPRPTAFFSSDDAMAVGIMRAVQELGLSIPGDVAIVGFGDSFMATQVTPTLSSIKVPKEKMGIIAAKRLLEIISGDGIEEKLHITVSSELVIRESSSIRPS